MKTLTLILVPMTFCTLAFGQPDPERKTSERQRILTYYTFGMGPQEYVDTAKLYGFRMKWKKCVIRRRHLTHNARVEKKINRRMGEDWLAQNIHSLEI